MNITSSRTKKYTVKEAASLIGFSGRVIRLHCKNGSCPCEYHMFPGTENGFYLLTEKSLNWLRKNIRPRGKHDRK